MKKILLIILCIACAAMITQVSAQEDENNDGIVTTKPGTELFSNDTGASLIAAKFIKQINILNKVTISNQIFNDASFKSLVDMSKPIPEEDAGRPNPFAPL